MLHLIITFYRSLWRRQLLYLKVLLHRYPLKNLQTFSWFYILKYTCVPLSVLRQWFQFHTSLAHPWWFVQDLQAEYYFQGNLHVQGGGGRNHDGYRKKEMANLSIYKQKSHVLLYNYGNLVGWVIQSFCYPLTWLILPNHSPIILLPAEKYSISTFSSY